MLEYLLFGGGYAFAAAVQPGPLQAFYFSRVAAIGWRRTLPATLAPVISDGPIALLSLLLLKRMPVRLETILTVAGGLALFYFAYMTYRLWRSGPLGNLDSGTSAPRTMMQAVVVNILNPAPYLGWSLVLGPMTVEAWRSAPAHAIGLVGSFYVVMVGTMGLFILMLGTTNIMNSQNRRRLLLLSAVTLAVIGSLRLYAALG